MLKKIEFLNKLFKILQCRTEILQFLKDEKLITDDEMQHVLNDDHHTHATRIATLLDQLLQKEKLQLVDYEWAILPNEFMKLTVVAPSDKKEWTHTV